MIELHRPTNDEFSDRIEETFEDLVLAYKTYRYDAERHQQESDRSDLPYIKEEGKVYAGQKEINDYLHQLRLDLQSIRSFTSDACYIDPDNGDLC